MNICIYMYIRKMNLYIDTYTFRYVYIVIHFFILIDTVTQQSLKIDRAFVHPIHVLISYIISCLVVLQRRYRQREGKRRDILFSL